MTRLDVRLIPKIAKLLDTYGKDVIFEEIALKKYDPENGTVTEAGHVQHPWKITPPEGYEARMIDGETIRTGDERTYIAAQDIPFSPVPGMKVSYDSLTWRVVSVQPIRTGEETGAYEIQLRK